MSAQHQRHKLIDRLLLLRLLSEFEPANRTALHKVLFFTELSSIQNNFCSPSFKYYRHKHGPYSTHLDNALDDLDEAGWIRRPTLQMTERGTEVTDMFWDDIAATPDNREVTSIMYRMGNKYGSMNSDQVKEEAYEVSLNPVDDSISEAKKVRELPKSTDILDPLRQVVHPREFEISSDTLEQLHYLLNVTEKDIERMNQRASGGAHEFFEL